MPFQKGHPRVGGRKRGSKTIAPIKQILAQIYTDEVQLEEWEKWRTHPDPKIAFEAFKLAQAYQHGKPIQPLSGGVKLLQQLPEALSKARQRARDAASTIVN